MGATTLSTALDAKVGVLVLPSNAKPWRGRKKRVSLQSGSSPTIISFMVILGAVLFVERCAGVVLQKWQPPDIVDGRANRLARHLSARSFLNLGSEDDDENDSGEDSAPEKGEKDKYEKEKDEDEGEGKPGKEEGKSDKESTEAERKHHAEPGAGGKSPALTVVNDCTGQTAKVFTIVCKMTLPFAAKFKDLLCSNVDAFKEALLKIQEEVKQVQESPTPATQEQHSEPATGDSNSELHRWVKALEKCRADLVGAVKDLWNTGVTGMAERTPFVSATGEMLEVLLRYIIQGFKHLPKKPVSPIQV